MFPQCCVLRLVWPQQLIKSLVTCFNKQTGDSKYQAGDLLCFQQVFLTVLYKAAGSSPVS